MIQIESSRTFPLRLCGNKHLSVNHVKIGIFVPEKVEEVIELILSLTKFHPLAPFYLSSV